MFGCVLGRSLLALNNKLGATKVTHIKPLSIWKEFVLWCLKFSLKGAL